jgi:hypothetical protein
LAPLRISVPAPALLSVPPPEMLAARLSVSVKFATILPRLSIAGVTIAPARPPLPRLSVLPAPILVKPGELTTPPLATVSVPTRQSQVSPILSEVCAVRTEPGPVTVTAEVPSEGSPTNTPPLTLTTPPLAIVRLPGPPVVPAPTNRPRPPMVQVDPGPLTVTFGMPRPGPLK